MTQITFSTRAGRFFRQVAVRIGGGLTLIAASNAWSLTNEAPLSPSQSLACLQKQRPAPQYKAEYSTLGDAHSPSKDGDTGLVRVKLSFKQPDAPPEISLLANTASEAMLNDVRYFLNGYRLPCLTASEGVVSAVQEFVFSPSKPIEQPAFPQRDEVPQACVVLPGKDVFGADVPTFSQGTKHVLLELEFSGDGSTPPKSKVVFSTGPVELEETAQRHVKSYRMPCRRATDPAFVATQQFTYRSPGSPAVTLKSKSMQLVDFLRASKDQKLPVARFGFDTMGCPFKVQFTHRAPLYPNKVEPVGDRARIADRTPFLTWLSQQQLNLSEREAQDIFGTELTISVPCGTMEW